MSCGVCSHKGIEHKSKVFAFDPPIKLGTKEVVLWRGECAACGGVTAICLTFEEAAKRLDVGWFEKVVE